MLFFSIAKPDVDAVLRKVLDEQRYLLGVDVVEEDELSVRHVHWRRDAPPIMIDEVTGKLAKLRIETALEDLQEVIDANPYAWFTQSPQEVRALRQRLKQASTVVRFRHPDVGMGWRGPFRVSRALAGKLRFQSGGVLKLADYSFETPGGKVIGR